MTWLKQSSFPGLAFSIGDGNADSTMTFTGTVAAINSALSRFTYVPNFNVNGPETLTISTNDLGHSGVGGAKRDSDVVSISITPVLDKPVADDDNYSTFVDTALTIAVPGVLGNDSDNYNDAFTAVVVDNPAHSTVTLNPNGSFTYTPASGYVGSDSFTYKANDGTYNSNLATVHLTIGNRSTPALVLNITPFSFSEGAGTGASKGTITRNNSTAFDLTVNLASSDESAATVPGTVVIPVGQSLVTFGINATNDNNDGDQTATITASSSGLLTATAQVTVTDDDSADTTAPAVTWSTPKDNAILQGFSALRGTAIEGQGTSQAVSGIADVKVQLLRQRDVLYSNGKKWQTTPFDLPTVMEKGTWTVAANLPAGYALTDGKYVLNAVATDNAGNFSKAVVHVIVDSQPPMVSFTSPTNGKTVSRLPYITGRSVDTVSGTNSERVQLFIRRASDGKYFDGSIWLSTATSLETKVVGNTWVRDGSAGFSLPSGAELKPGLYYLTAITHDRADNRSVSTIVFTLASTVPAT